MIPVEMSWLFVAFVLGIILSDLIIFIILIFLSMIHDTIGWILRTLERKL